MSADNGGCGAWIAIAVAAVAVWQCSRDKSPNDIEPDYSSYSSGVADRSDYDRGRSYPVEDYRASERYVGSGYQDAGAPYGCTDDCSGHDAGWEWAEENGVTDPDDCGGKSMSFEEGCIAYAEQQETDRTDEDRW